MATGNLGARRVIREARLAQGLSIRKLAELAQVDHTHLSRYEKGEAGASQRWLRDVCTALGRNLSDIEQAS